ncbi:hypothetical protein OOK36_41940 [Streptomyces sp. NBC_00365]|uniref:hypothetical protein n=1 Tax=Streptomyces sp. NBC_00365 TaxID=2975726 RepID=UPI00225A352E|nr:hypothetical protein [Streptomyces sp. NBC_00365]MCX5095293.1 hypothetical protein [Streptomyces sp. NBC_00365]
MAHAPRQAQAQAQAQAAASAAVGATKPFSVYEAEEGTPGGGAAVRSLTSAPTTQCQLPRLCRGERIAVGHPDRVSRITDLRRPGGEHDQRRAVRLGRSASRVTITANNGWPAGQVSEFQIWNP